MEKHTNLRGGGEVEFAPTVILTFATVVQGINSKYKQRRQSKVGRENCNYCSDGILYFRRWYDMYCATNLNTLWAREQSQLRLRQRDATYIVLAKTL